TALGLAGAGLPAAGSFAFGLAWASVGIAFAAVAAVTAQITRSARAAIAMAVSVLGVTYVLRAVGDTAGDRGAGWLRWLSPVGWGWPGACTGARWSAGPPVSRCWGWCSATSHPTSATSSRARRPRT